MKQNKALVFKYKFFNIIISIQSCIIFMHNLK